MASGSASVEESRHLLKQLSHQSSSESCVGEELDLLTNVYFDDLQISHTEGGPSLSLHVTPSTADDKEKQFVYLDLTILLPPQYPHLVPMVNLGQSRGLSDAHLRGISEGLALKCSELLGSPMVYELVEYARDCLTDNNLPCSHCAICLVQFQEGDDFTKTDCYHYLHVPCMARYIEFFERERREMEREAVAVDTMLRKKPKQLECPVCRDPINPGSACLDAVAGSRTVTLLSEDEAIHFTPPPELKAWQDRMASLLWKQKQKGGVVNLNSGDDVIDETWVSSVSRKQNNQIIEDKEIAVADHEEPTGVCNEGSEKQRIDNASRDTAEGQRTDSSGTERKKTSEKHEAGGRRRGGNRNGRISEKRSDNQKNGDGGKRTFDKQEVERRRANVHYRGRENGIYDQDTGREVRENGQGRSRYRRRDWQSSDGVRRGHPRETRDQRSQGARQRGSGRTFKLNAVSAKDRSIPRYQQEDEHTRDAVQPGVGAGVKLKNRNTDIQLQPDTGQA